MSDPACDKCDSPCDKLENEYGEILCDNCEANAAEAAYERQQEADLESPPETMREQQIRTWEEHKKAHKR